MANVAVGNGGHLAVVAAGDGIVCHCAERGGDKIARESQGRQNGGHTSDR